MMLVIIFEQIFLFELNATNINRKRATSHRKIGLPLNRFFYNYESNHHFAATISFDYVLITALSLILV